MATFKSMRKRNKDSLDKLRAKVQEKDKSYNDDRFWFCERDKAGNGFAIIRFLDVSKADIEVANDDSDLVPWVHYYTHGFKNDQGRWFFDNCLTSLGQDCPVCEANGELWNSGIDSNKDIARQRKRKEHYVSNIYIVKDTANPENEGKVFLFRYGPKIFQKISGAMNPEFEDEIGFNPFDYYEGANFKFKIRVVDDYVNYDKSEFEPQSPLFETEEEMEEVWAQSYALQEIVSKDKFTSYDEMKSKFNKIVGSKTNDVAKTVEETMSTPEYDPDDDIPMNQDDDDDMDYFRSKLDDDD